MRNEVLEELVLEARRNPRIFLVVGDLGYSVVEAFAREFPDRFINAGVAEQSMTGLAAGLASEGYQVFTYSIANFPTFRCAEQFRNDVAYHNLPVTAVAVGGGLSYGNLGYSHHAVQDLALMRSFPGVLIAAPGDPLEAQACIRYLSSNPRPAYLRLGKAGEPRVHPAPLEVRPGVFQRCLSPDTGTNQSLAILTTGAALKLGHDVANHETLGNEWALFSLPLWQTENAPQICDFIRRFDFVAIMEDHLAAGGFGSFVRECLEAEPNLQNKVRCFSLDPKVCGMVADQAHLNRVGGLDAEVLAGKLKVLSHDPSRRITLPSP